MEEEATLEISLAAVDFIQVRIFNGLKFIPYDNVKELSLVFILKFQRGRSPK